LIGYGTTERAGSGRRRRPAAVRAKTPADLGETSVSRTVPAESSEKPTSVREADAARRRPVAVRSPLVRRLARDLGLDVHT
ncbi:hypothetical protein SB769_39335, partial [Burkholderia sp. SIMBA_024]